MDSPDPETFGPLAAIAPESLVLLASNIAKRCLDLPNTSGTLVARISGSYNMTHVIELENVKLVIRVPATGWGSGLTHVAADAMESQVATIRLIRSKTTIPVPEIYALDTSFNDEIGVPYLCMSFIPGKPVSEVWFDYSGTLPRDEFRLRILTSLSQTMAQFSCFAFDRMGSIMESGSDSTVIGPSYDWDEKEDGSLQVTTAGPYDSTSVFLDQNLIEGSSENGHAWSKAAAKLLEVMLDCLPAPDSPETLERYRAHYNTELGKAHKWQGDWKYTEKSHIFEAIWIAALHRLNRLEICRKFVQAVAGDNTDASDILYDIGTGRYKEEDWVTLKANLWRFICEA